MPSAADADAQRGSGSVLAIAVSGAIAVATAVALPLYMGLAAHHTVMAAADAAALAAADTVSGFIAGEPCDSASRVAAANGADVVSCDVDGLIVTVRAGTTILGIAVIAGATAGPPRGNAD